MRIAELSRETGVPVPTIKYYLREGLLPPGELSSPNQAWYTDRHVQRLRLVRALIDVGRLPIATIKDLLADIDQPERDLHHMLGRALEPMTTVRERGSDVDLAAARQEIDDLITRRGWLVTSDAPARQAAAEVVAAMRHLGSDDLLAFLDRYADAAEIVADTDLKSISGRTDPDDIVTGAVIGTILGDVLNAGLRRLAQEDASARAFGDSSATADTRASTQDHPTLPPER